MTSLLLPNHDLITTTPLVSNLRSWRFFSLRRSSLPRHSSSLPLVALSATTTAAKPRVATRWREKHELAESDSISILNERIRRDLGKRETGSRPVMDSKEAEKYIQMVKEQQERGLQKLKGVRPGGGTDGGGFSYKVDPYTLVSGDYVVHKKVGIGRFVGIKLDVPKDSSDPLEYVFIEYADGMAKLPLKQASRLLYRYNLSVTLFFSLSLSLLFYTADYCLVCLPVLMSRNGLGL